MNRKHAAALFAGLALCIASAPARAQDRPPTVPQQEEEFSEAAQVLGPATVKMHFRGQNASLRARATSLEDEFMVVADAPELQRVAKAFGARFEWRSATLTLVSYQGAVVRSLRVGHDRVEGNSPAAGAQEAGLPLAAQVLDGAVHIPLSSLEELLGVRVTGRPGNHVYIEPLIRNVHFEGSEQKPRLVIEANAPVTYKAFTLKNPPRYVVDVQGAVLDTPALTVQHPDLGTVRLGQFELGPAISRIVVPMPPGVQINAPRIGSGETLSFNMQMTGPRAVAQNPAGKITDVQVTKTDKGYKLVLNANGPLRYEWQRLAPPDYRMVVDIPGAVLSDPKQEFELGKEFATTLRMSQNQPQPNPSVRLVIDMNRPSEVNFSPGETEDQLVVEILDKEVEAASVTAKGVGSTRPVAAATGGGLIVIDAGHGGSDVGAQNKALGLNEATVTLDIAKRLASILRTQGWNVVMTRQTDVDVSYWASPARVELGARCEVANKRKADLFLSIHCNASVSPSSNGTSIHYYKQSDYVLASALQPHVLSATGRANRGLQANRFYVLAHTQMPAVLVETAFLSNREEGQLLGDPAYRQRIAEGLAAGLRQYATRNLNWSASAP